MVGQVSGSNPGPGGMDVVFSPVFVRHRSFQTPRSGYFQTGLSSAQECAVLLSNGTSTCGGGAACVAIRTFQPAPWGCHGTYGAWLQDVTFGVKKRSKAQELLRVGVVVGGGLAGKADFDYTQHPQGCRRFQEAGEDPCN